MSIGLEIDGIRVSSFGPAQGIRHALETAWGFTIRSSDGRQKTLHDLIGTQGKAAVIEQRPELFLGDVRFQRDQGLQLVVAVLLDDVIDVVGVQERFHIGTKREAAYAHVVAGYSPLRQN